MPVFVFQILIVLGDLGGMGCGRKPLHIKKLTITMEFLVFGILFVEHGMTLLAILLTKLNLSLLEVLYRLLI